MFHQTMRGAPSALALAFALWLGAGNTHAQTIPAAWGTLPRQISVCTLQHGHETCRQQNLASAPLTLSTLREILNARMPAAGGLYPDEGIRQIEIALTWQADGHFRAVATLHYLGGREDEEFDAIQDSPSSAVRVAVLRSLPNERTVNPDPAHPNGPRMVTYFQATLAILGPAESPQPTRLQQRR